MDFKNAMTSQLVPAGNEKASRPLAVFNGQEIIVL